LSTSDQAKRRVSGRSRVSEADAGALGRSSAVAASRPVSVRGAAEMVPIEHETPDRIVRTLVFVLPPAALGVSGWLAWGGRLHWQDLLVLAITYTLTGLGITVGYHRLFTHRSFKTTRSVRALLAVLGPMAVEGPVLGVGRHAPQAPSLFRPSRRPPQSPCRSSAGLAGGAAGTVARARRLDVARQGHGQPRPLREGSAGGPPHAVDQPYIPALGGLWVGRSVRPRRGADRLGSRRPHRAVVGWGGADLPFASRDIQHQFAVPLVRPATVRHPRSVAQPRLAGTAGIGEAWHNNHHAFPTSARHGLGRWELDPGAWLIAALERSHLAWDVIRISPHANKPNVDRLLRARSRGRR
jgi:stearoyl-CoA desaturase (Delta-9 desaturase)